MEDFYSPTNEEMRLIRQHYKTIHVLIDIYTDQGCTNYMGSIHGNLMSDQMNIDSSSTQRRTYSCTLVVDDSFLKVKNRKNHINHFDIDKESYIWIDRYFKIYYGIDSVKDINVENYVDNERVKIVGKTLYWLLGTFTLVSPNYNYSATTRTLSLSLADYMCLYDGTKNGQIDGSRVIGSLETEPQLRLNMSYNFKICAVAEYSDKTNPDGTRKVKSYMKMKDAILATLHMAGIATKAEYDSNSYKGANYEIQGYDYEEYQYVPSDQEFEPGQTYNDVWTKLRDLYSNYEYYFDATGRFIWREIPTG